VAKTILYGVQGAGNRLDFTSDQLSEFETIAGFQKKNALGQRAKNTY